ncbi:MAG: hypothetical protein K2N64_05240 [Anaeroplasmataceae bacterium]|nr:hypothetical protein [Anaeroplasmataceae bacterium]
MKVILNSKKSELKPLEEIEILKEVILKDDEFEHFIHNLLGNYDFIKEHTDKLVRGLDKTTCLLVKSDVKRGFGVLVCSEGFRYARYTCILPFISE